MVMLMSNLLKLPIPKFVLSVADIGSNANAFMAMLMIGVGFQLNADKAQLKYVASMVGLRFGIGLLVAAAFYFLLRHGSCEGVHSQGTNSPQS